MSGHTYADVSQFKSFLIDGGDASWTQSDTILLTLLEGASRRIDEWADRSDFGSGFGPRTGTNKYDYPNDDDLDLRDDLLTITSVTAHDVYGDTGRTLTDGTHFIKRPSGGVYPYRELELLYSSTGVFGAAQEGNVIIGTWGYSNETYSLATGGTLTASATSLILSGGSAYAGQTLLVDSEQLYVTASGGTATVVRGVNGTTAATHAASVAVSAYRYPRDVVTACLRLTAYRHREAQSGITGELGGGNIPVTSIRSEAGILRSTVGHLRIIGIG
jgi:hypothetical protein